MEFGGVEQHGSPDFKGLGLSHQLDDASTLSPAEQEEEGVRLDQEIKLKALLHMAKKNLCFELEYIQAVIERLDGKS